MSAHHEIQVRQGRGRWIVVVTPPSPEWPDEAYPTESEALVHARARRFATGWQIKGYPRQAKRKPTGLWADDG